MQQREQRIWQIKRFRENNTHMESSKRKKKYLQTNICSQEHILISDFF